MTLLTFVLIAGTPAARPATGDSATIVNSGSTNLPGFRIVVAPSGIAEFTQIPRGRDAQAAKTKPVRLTVSRMLTDRFFTDLKDASPLGALPEPHCMKSTSFGSRLTIEFGREQTPDLSCGSGGNPEVQSLIRDCNAIVALFQAQ